MNLHKIISYFLLANTLCIVSKNAIAIECVYPPDTTIKNYQMEFDISAARVLSIKGPSASGALKSEAKSLLEKIPNSEKTLIDLTYLFTLCTALRDDKMLAEREKAKLISTYVQALNVQPTKILKSSTASKNIQATPPINETRKSSTDRYNTQIHGNTAPVINNSTAGGNISITTTEK